MRSTRFILMGSLSILGLGACLAESSGDVSTVGGAVGTSGGPAVMGGTTGATGTTGGTTTSSGGVVSTGGSTGSGGVTSIGGSTGLGGVVSTGGSAGSGGGDSGGVTGSGGSTAGGGSTGAGSPGSGGVMASGGTGMGGMGGPQSGAGGDGGASGTAGGGTAGGSATGGTMGTGECVTGQTSGSEVAVIGESFIAASHQITQQIESRAKAEGSLGQNEHYVDNSVSGTTLANNQIPSQYDKAVQSSGTITYVLMDGGGNDCLISNNGPAALGAATTLFENMAEHNTEKVVFFFYPDPIGPSFTSLKSCLDNLRPQMKAICDELTTPKCYWLDLRDVWNGHDEYTSDGIHPTTAGSKATGDAIWEVMKANCVAQ